jgi:predicted amidophosphoribosyltransferase
MVKELLVCQMCQKPWKRIKSRGRKPRFCAKCFAEALMEIEQDILPEEPKFKQDRAKIMHWVCPACNKGLTTYVGVSQAPTCQNPTAHSSKSIEMIQHRREKVQVA